MTLFVVPWLELAVAVPFAGAAIARRGRDPRAGWRLGFSFAAGALACATLAWAGHQSGAAPGGTTPNDLLPRIAGGRVFALDELNAPLVPFVALLHLLVLVGTTGGKAPRLSFSALLASQALQLAIFAAVDAPVLVAALALATLRPLLELRTRDRSTRVYSIHMGLFVALLAGGLAASRVGGPAAPLGWVPLTLAVLLRCGVAPGHLWVGDLFRNASFGTSLLFLTPMTGVYAAARLLLPACPAAALEAVGVLGLVTAVYSAGLAVVQTEARRFVASLCVGNTGLVLAGVMLTGELGVTGALALWASAGVSLTGAGFALRAVESRVGPVGLVEFRGLYDRAPALAVCFLFAGLGTVGFPGTVGFLPLEVLIERAVAVNPAAGVAMVLTVAINGFAVVRAYTLVFTGGRHASPVPLGVTIRERFTVLALALLVFGGGLVPQALLHSRQRAAGSLLEQREHSQVASPRPAPRVHSP